MKRIVRTVLVTMLLSSVIAQPARASCVSSSDVFGSVSQSSPTTWLYKFGVTNGCTIGQFPVGQQLMTDFYLPYFADAGITNITVPAPDAFTYGGRIVTWAATIQQSNNLFNLPKAGVIDFHVTVTPEPLAGPGVGYYGAFDFSFTAGYNGVKGPDAIRQIPLYNNVYGAPILLFGDPPIPGSPMTLVALGIGPVTTAPEPATLGLTVFGLAALVPALRRLHRPRNS